MDKRSATGPIRSQFGYAITLAIFTLLLVCLAMIDPPVFHTLMYEDGIGALAAQQTLLRNA